MLRDAVRGRRRLLGVGIAPGVFLLSALAGCGDREAADSLVSRSSALTRTWMTASDTFINSHDPDNNNGASASIFTGLDGMGGVMRGLIRFDLPAELQGRVTVTGAQLSLTTRGLGPNDAIAGTPATESLQAVGEDWAAGNGAGNVQTLFVVGEPCGGAITGATWNQRDCAAAGAAWSSAGATVAAATSAQAAAPASAGTAVVWDGTAAGNAGMLADVQRWIDTPSANHGWRITSSTEAGAPASAQRFYASEAPVTPPTLTLVYDCKVGWVASGSDCVDRNQCLPDPCHDGGDAAALCTDHPAPATGYDCACSPAFSFDGATCVRITPPDAASDAGTAPGDAAVADGARDAAALEVGPSGCSCAVATGGDQSAAALIFGAALAGLAGRRHRRGRRAI